MPSFVKGDVRLMLPHDSGEAGELSETEGADCVAISDRGIFNNYKKPFCDSLAILALACTPIILFVVLPLISKSYTFMTNA